MRRPPLFLVLALTGMWLLMNSTLGLGHVLLGLAVSLLMVFGFRAVRPLQPRIRRPLVVVRLLAHVFVDVLRSNLAVARIVLALQGRRTVRSGFLHVPLDMRDPHGLAVLATIVTSTPGTVWVDLSPDSSLLTLHVLDLLDEQTLIGVIKQRYEKPLMEIFE